MDIRRFTTAVGKYLINPIVKAAIALGLAPRSYAILETTERRTPYPTTTPRNACGRSVCASMVLSCRSWAPNCSQSRSILIPKRLVAGLSCLAWDGV